MLSVPSIRVTCAISILVWSSPHCCLPSPSLNHVSPFTRLFGHIPDYSNLHIFGCVLCSSPTHKILHHHYLEQFKLHLSIDNPPLSLSTMCLKSPFNSQLYPPPIPIFEPNWLRWSYEWPPCQSLLPPFHHWSPLSTSLSTGKSALSQSSPSFATTRSLSS